MVVRKSFLSLPRFLVKNAKINVLEEKCFLSKMFYQIKMQAATNWSSHFKNIQHSKIFYPIFKNCIFLRFLKIISSTSKNHCMGLILCEHGRQNPTELVQSILQ